MCLADQCFAAFAIGRAFGFKKRRSLSARVRKASQEAPSSAEASVQGEAHQWALSENEPLACIDGCFDAYCASPGHGLSPKGCSGGRSCAGSLFNFYAIVGKRSLQVRASVANDAPAEAGQSIPQTRMSAHSFDADLCERMQQREGDVFQCKLFLVCRLLNAAQLRLCILQMHPVCSSRHSRRQTLGRRPWSRQHGAKFFLLLRGV